MPKRHESFLTHISLVEDHPESFLADVVVAENEPLAKCISRVGGAADASQTLTLFSQGGRLLSIWKHLEAP